METNSYLYLRQGISSESNLVAQIYPSCTIMQTVDTPNKNRRRRSWPLSDPDGFFPLDLIRESLWGKNVDFTRFGCTHWELACQIPTLYQFSICVDFQRSISTPQWTVFMYSHPGQALEDIGLKGNEKYLYLWLFGKVWTSRFSIHLNVWYSVCITWSQFTLSPHLYINGKSVEIQYSEQEPLTASRRHIVGGGHFTLGVSHFRSEGKIHLEMGTVFQGNMTLFRIWNKTLPASQLEHCVDGNVVRWVSSNWNTQGCAPIKDTSCRCGESKFQSLREVMFPCPLAAVSIQVHFDLINESLFNLIKASCFLCLISFKCGRCMPFIWLLSFSGGITKRWMNTTQEIWSITG